MGFNYVDDSATMDLDQCLIDNHTRHRSPIIHLPEIFMYQYSCADVMECANNFKSCSMDNNTDPVVNTANYYARKFDGKIAHEAIEAICDIIYENAYAIFHIGKDGTTYMASLNSENPTVCIDSVCLNWNQLPDNAYDMQVMWKTGNKAMSYDLFAKQLFDKFHDEDYVMNRGLKNILASNSERRECFNRMPSFTYAMEDADDYNLAENEAEARKHYKISEFTFSPATEAPIDDALDDLDQMSGRSTRPEANNPPAETGDNTADGRAVDIAKMTNDRMEADGDRNTEELANEDEDEANADNPAPEDEGNAEDEENPDDNLGEDLDPTDAEADNPEDEEDEDVLNDPETKEVYRKRLIALYKHINDIIDTLERFTPAYNVNCTVEYYNVQNSAHRLKSAIYKICTEKMKDMETVDVMKAYLTANYAYDAIGVTLKDFFKRYRVERDKAKI